MSASSSSSGDDRSGRPIPQDALQLQSVGITMLSVVLGIGVTVALGVDVAWWLRVLLGIATVLVLLVGLRLGSSRRRGPLARLAAWVTRSDE